MRLTIWHFDRYPTAPGVYLDVLSRRHHEITWVNATVGRRDAVVESRRGAVRHFDVQRAAASRWPRPWSTLVNRAHKLIGFFQKVSLMERLARERPDVLQVRELIVEGVLGLWCARRHGVRFAFQLDYPHYEGWLFAAERTGRASPLLRLGVRWWIHWRGVVLRGADLVFAISDAQAEWLTEKHGVRRERIVPFPVGVAGAAADGPPHTRVAALAGSPLVIYMGNLTPLRDPDLLLRVFEATARHVPEARLLVIGEIDAGVGARIARSPARDRITSTGFVPHAEVASLLRAGRVGIFPMPTEDPYGIYRTSSPLKVMEYFAAGLPVVSSRIPEAELVIGESGGGACVDNDPERFAAAIAVYLEDADRARAHGARGCAYVARHRSFEALADRVEDAYRRLLSGEAPSTSTMRAPSARARSGQCAGGVSSHSGNRA